MSTSRRDCAPGVYATPPRSHVPRERLFIPPLNYLKDRRWVRHDTLVVHELPWHGRHVDMVTRTRGGINHSAMSSNSGSFSRVLTIRFTIA